MASAFQANATQAAQHSINERRLRPIYDLLDNSNTKKALQEADKVLKKHPDFPCCKVLKGLALVRLGRDEEGEALVDAVLKEGNIDESTLHAMTLAYRELDQANKICEAYDIATKRYPHSEELLTQHFMALVKQDNFKRQQQVALALHKLKPKVPFYLWAVMSVVQQACFSRDEKLAISVTLPLAERMMSVSAKDGKVSQEQEIKLYLLILELQNKYSEALDILEGPMGSNIQKQSAHLNFCELKKMDYLKRLQKWDEIRLLAAKMVTMSADNWAVFLDYLTSLFNLEEKPPIDDARSFLREMQKESKLNRGPFLAEIELEKMLLSRNDGSVDNLCGLLIAYFERFSSKPCCASDVKVYLSYLHNDLLEKFFGETLKGVNLQDENVPQSPIDIQKHVCWHQLRRVAGYHSKLSEKAGFKLISELFQLNSKTESCVENFSNTEIRPNDGYLVLAGHLAWQMWTDTFNDEFFWLAVINLQSGLKKSPSNYDLKLLLIKFFNQNGAVALSKDFYKLLEAKHIQLDSIGYLLLRHYSTCGQVIQLSLHYDEVLKFFTGNYKNTSDYISQCYRYGSFDQILEFMKLRNRLLSSQHYVAVTVERLLLDVMTSEFETAVQVLTDARIDPTKDEIIWNDLVDNRDFKAMQSWDPPESCFTEQDIRQSFVMDQFFIKMRNLTLRSLVAASGLVSDSSKQTTDVQAQNGHETQTDTLSALIPTLISQFEDLIKEIQSNYKVSLEDDFKKTLNPLQGPQRSRLYVYLNDGHSEVFIAALKLLSAIHGAVKDTTDLRFQKERQVVDHCHDVSQSFDKIVEDVLARVNTYKNESIVYREWLFESIANLTQTASFCNVILGVCHSLLSDKTPIPKSTSNKKSKKKPPEPKQNISADLSTSFNQLTSSIHSKLDTFLAGIETLRKSTTAEGLPHLEGLNLSSDTYLQDWSQLRDYTLSMMKNSYHNFFGSFSTVVQKKINFKKLTV